MGFRTRTSGSFDGIQRFFDKALHGDIYARLDVFGVKGCDALAAATPVNSGETAASWSYRVIDEDGKHAIEWFNTNNNDGVNIAVIIQYGHGTGTGGYVAGIDYINPALAPIFDEIEADFIKEVTS